MRPCLLAALTVLAVGCGYRGQSRSTLSSSTGTSVHQFDIDDANAYIVDPASRSCALRHVLGATMAIMPIDCANLAAAVPEAAAVITWAGAPPPAAP